MKNIHSHKRKSIAYIVLNTKETTGTKLAFEHAKKFKEKGYDARIYTIFGGKPKWSSLQIPVKNIIHSFIDSVPDIVVATFWPTSYLVAFLIRGKEKFYFIQDWEENFYINPLFKFFARITYTFPIKKITISRYLQKKIQKYDKSKLQVYWIRYSTLNNAFFEEPRNRNKKYPYSKNNEKIKILSVMSWYNIHKGPDLLAQVIERIKKKYPNYHFTLISREKKVYSPVFDKFISNPKLSDIVKVYKESDILLATSRSEGFFIPGLEAMASGCLFITTNSYGILDYAKHNENSVILDKIENLWEKDIIEKTLGNKKLVKKLVSNGYKTAEKYNSKYLIRDIERIYFGNPLKRTQENSL